MRGLLRNRAVRVASALLALLLGSASLSQTGAPPPAPAKPATLAEDPLAWLPANETLTFMIEATWGPVRSLDVGTVSLACAHAQPPKRATMASAPVAEDPQRLLATIDGRARGKAFGRTVHHTIAVRWYAGNRPRIESLEALRGSRVQDRELRVAEKDGQWQLEFRKDRHCKGCEDKEHFTEGLMPWSKPSHCKDCDRLRHRVWREPRILDVPPHAVDIVSALYLARGFLRGQESSTSISLVNQNELWSVKLTRGSGRPIEVPAGKFECVRVLIGPELAGGDGPQKKSAERFEALFGLHGDITIWVDKSGGFPVQIEGSAPFGPFDVHVKASLTSRSGN